MNEIDDWLPEQNRPRCSVCNNYLDEHWRGRECALDSTIYNSCPKCGHSSGFHHTNGCIAHKGMTPYEGKCGCKYRNLSEKCTQIPVKTNCKVATNITENNPLRPLEIKS